MIAVLGFLRTEGDAYDRVMSRAGELAAEWSVAALPGVERRLILWLPRPLTARAALGVARRIVRSIFSASKASSRVRRREARLSIKSSLFCDVREHQPAPLCGFYRGVATATLAAFGLSAAGRVESCHAMDGGAVRDRPRRLRHAGRRRSGHGGLSDVLTSMRRPFPRAIAVVALVLSSSRRGRAAGAPAARARHAVRGRSRGESRRAWRVAVAG